MGGRGSSSGMSVKGKPYGTEYTTLYKSGNIKFVRYNDASSAKTPMETMTRGRVYVTVNGENNLVAITYHDNENKRSTVERLLRHATGHEDNSSTQAARRALAKRGIDWKTGKKLKK